MVERYQNSHFEQCVGVFINVYNASPWNDKWTVETASSHLRELINNQRFVGFVLTDGKCVLGAAFCYEKTWWSGQELYIDEFYISIHNQRQGLGAELMNAIQRYASENSMTNITLITDKNKPAFEFYKKNGFLMKEQLIFMYK